MIEFFIALFGGLYYGGKFLNEKAELNVYESKQRKRMETLENIKSQYAADWELERYVKNLILKGDHFDDICNQFAEDFQYVFGEDWKEKLRIPPKPPVLNPKVYKDDAYSFNLSINHITWVYHLLLAKEGKIDKWAITSGFHIGGIDEKDMNIKFAECIEKHLLRAGVQGIKLVLELDHLCGTRYRTPENVCGGDIKIESLCNYPTYRLWGDNINKDYSNK